MLKGRALGYAPLMHEELVTSTRHWGQEGEIDLPQVTNELTVNIASRVAVVGAGPVGAVAALAHARRGARVALCEANPSSARRLAGEWLHPPAIQVLRELGIDLPSAIPEHAAGQGFVVFPDDVRTSNTALSPGRAIEPQRAVDPSTRRPRSIPGSGAFRGLDLGGRAGRHARRRGPQRLVGHGLDEIPETNYLKTLFCRVL